MSILHVLRRRVLPLALLLGSVTPAFAQPRPAQPMTLAPAGGVLLPINFLNTACFSQTTKDSYIQEVAANDLGIYTGATNCASGTLRFDVSTTAITSTVPNLGPNGSGSAPAWSFANAPNRGIFNDATNTALGVSAGTATQISAFSNTLGFSFMWTQSFANAPKLIDQGANVLGQANGAAVQTFNVGTTGIKAPQDKLTNILDSTDTVGVEFNVGTPTLGTCTGGSVVSGAKNSLFEVTGNTSGSCVVNFGAPIWQNAPLCFVNDETALIAIRISARTTNSITVTGAGSGDAFQVYCLGRVGT